MFFVFIIEKLFMMKNNAEFFKLILQRGSIIISFKNMTLGKKKATMFQLKLFHEISSYYPAFTSQLE